MASPSRLKMMMGATRARRMLLVYARRCVIWPFAIRRLHLSVRTVVLSPHASQNRIIATGSARNAEQRTSSSSSELLLEVPWSLTLAHPAAATAAARLSPFSLTQPKLRPLAPAWNSALKVTCGRKRGS